MSQPHVISAGKVGVSLRPDCELKGVMVWMYEAQVLSRASPVVAVRINEMF